MHGVWDQVDFDYHYVLKDMDKGKLNLKIILPVEI